MTTSTVQPSPYINQVNTVIDSPLNESITFGDICHHNRKQLTTLQLALSLPKLTDFNEDVSSYGTDIFLFISLTFVAECIYIHMCVCVCVCVCLSMI